jgi:DNA modification methylase
MSEVKLHLGDCANVMAEFEPDCIDLTVTSPPYDNLRDYKGYVFEFEAIAAELYRVTKPGGVIVWVVADATINGSETGTSFLQALHFMELGFNLHDTMIYRKINPIPLTHNRYEQEYEYMFIFSKGRPVCWNPLMKKNVGSGKKISWSSREVEKGAARRCRNETTVTKDKSYRGNIWDYVIAKDKIGNHPAPFPEALARDHILSWSNPGDLVLDPMMGSGTTGKMAVKYERNFIGIDISDEYLKIAEKRIHDAQQQMRLPI